MGHVQEMLTGFRSGAADTALPGEPRADYHPSRRLTERYDAKAQEPVSYTHLTLPTICSV